MYVIYISGWLWNGLSTVTSTLPDHKAGMTFGDISAATHVASELRRVHGYSIGKITIKEVRK